MRSKFFSSTGTTWLTGVVPDKGPLNARVCLYQLMTSTLQTRHTCVNDDIMRGSFDKPDVAAIAFEEIQLTNQIQPIMNWLCVEPVTAGYLSKQQLHHQLKSVRFLHN